MTVGFFGHSSYIKKEGDKEKILRAVEEKAKGEFVEFFVNCYGNFDNFGFVCAKEYQKTHENSKVTFVTPYLCYSRCNDFAKRCDETVYPELEKVPHRLAIIRRNMWVVDKSDFIIFYYHWVGALDTVYEYANKKGKDFINLFEK